MSSARSVSWGATLLAESSSASTAPRMIRSSIVEIISSMSVKPDSCLRSWDSAIRRVCRTTSVISTICPVRLSRTGPRLSALGQADHHVLQLGVVLERVRRQVLAVAGLLETAVRHLGYERDVVVHPHGAEAQLPR